MVKRYWKNLALSSVLAFTFLASASSTFGQGLDTRASKDDWEEINFDFNSAVLSDGFPSLLRLAELLKANPAYRVRAEGHADGIGSDKYNEKLGLQRAQMVRDFLVKYGAAAGQVEVTTKGKNDPRAKAEKPYYGPTDEARFMNRRVVLTVMDGQGRTVSAGGAADAIRSMANNKGMQDCCDDVLKRLDKLDDIMKMLRDLKDQNAALRGDLDKLKGQQQAMQDKIAGLGNATAGAQGPQGPQGQQGPTGPSSAAGNANTAANTKGGKSSSSAMGDGLLGGKLALMGANVGADDLGHTTATAKLRYFSPISESSAIQAQGEYIYYHERKEAQFDLGLVHRIGDFQGGVFGSMKHVQILGAAGANLGQFAVTGDYLFKYGKVGLFGTKGFMDGGVISSTPVVLANGAIAPNYFIEKSVSIVDQLGVSTTLGLHKHAYFEGNLGYLRSYNGNSKPGGTMRLVFPVNSMFALTAEGGINETMIGPNVNGRATFGIQFGNLLRPREFQSSGKPVPVDVPRVRYDVLTRTVRRGPGTPPVADAGPDQLAIAAGLVRLDGSNSYDPNGLALTYQWVQEIGPSVALSSATSAVTTFQAAAGQQYTFRLNVKNSDNLSASARVRVTTTADNKPRILFFYANPTSITKGATSQLQWAVENADTVTLDGQNVQASGTLTVKPDQTTSYKLVATNKSGSDNAVATVAVGLPDFRILSCFATPATIFKGESANLVYQTQGASTVNIQPGIGAAALNGTIAVTPAITTTYIVTATSADGRTDTCSATVGVTDKPSMPQIVSFFANPTLIGQGAKSTLTWSTQNAKTVTISTIGNVQPNGSMDVTPQATIQYVLTATNDVGSVTATARVRVIPAVKITSFTATPTVSPAPGAPVTLRCLADNATKVDIQPNNGQGVTSGSAATQVFPQQDTTYTCTATGQLSTDTKTLLVKVTPNPVLPPPGAPPVVVFKSSLIETNVREVGLDASGSYSPAGNNPLTYKWTSRSLQAAVINANSPTPIVQLSQLIGDYYFDCTVTDSRGQSTTSTLIVRLIKQPLTGPTQ